MPYKTVIRLLKKASTTLLIIMGGIFIVQIILASTSVPFKMQYGLAYTTPNNHASCMPEKPQQIIMLGGAGMPSGDNMVRLSYAASASITYQCPIIIVHPFDSSCISLMDSFLCRQGIPIQLIVHDTLGTNTRSQALALAETHPNNCSATSILITSPEQMFRSAKTFRNVGFSSIYELPAFEGTVDFELSLQRQKLGGHTNLPTVESSHLRYTFWNYWKLEISCLREYFAIAYYWMHGWL